MDNQVIPLLTQIVPRYEGIYPPETIEIVYRSLIGRINSLAPIVQKNEKSPLLTEAERKNYEKGQGAREMALRFQNNEATRKALEDCKVAWFRLINGTAHICTACDGNISKDRKQAVPEAGKCKECQEKTGIRVY